MQDGYLDRRSNVLRWIHLKIEQITARVGAIVSKAEALLRINSVNLRTIKDAMILFSRLQQSDQGSAYQFDCRITKTMKYWKFVMEIDLSFEFCNTWSRRSKELHRKRQNCAILQNLYPDKHGAT